MTLNVCAKRQSPKWIEDIKPPSVPECVPFLEKLEKVEKGIQRLKLDRDEIRTDLSLKDKEIFGLQRELLELRTEVEILSDENMSLKEWREATEKELSQFRKVIGPIEALSILKAAENRILKIVLEGASSENVLYYCSVRFIVEDEDDGCLPPSISTKWQMFKPIWNQKVMSRIFGRLSEQRGVVCHREDRDPQYYETLPVTSLIQSFSAFGLKKEELAAIERVHAATLVSNEISPVDDA